MGVSMIGIGYNLEKRDGAQFILLAVLSLDILNCMDQDWPEVAAEAATNPFYSLIPTVLLSIFSGRNEIDSGSRKRKLLVIYLLSTAFSIMP